MNSPDSADRPSSLPPEVWPRAHRAAARLISPIQRVLEIEATSGVILLVVAVVALIWANTAGASSYEALWHTAIGGHSGGISLDGVYLAAAATAAVLALRATGVRHWGLYVVPGVLLWVGLYRAGVHPTLAGVVLGLLTPVRSWYGPSRFAETTHAHLADISHGGDRHVVMARLSAIETARREAVSPSERLQHVLHPWVAFAIMPLFALANAGVAVGNADLSGDGLYVFIGIVAGLAVGKPLGIYLASAIAAAARVATRPPDAGHSGIVLVGMVGGIGFTMSLFVAQLAFPPGPLLDTAKLAILVGSGAAMVMGAVFGLVSRRPPV